jgi:aminopeptidase N
VARALSDLGDVKARGALRERLDTDLDARVRRRIRETLRDLGGEGKRAMEPLREELEKLQGEHGDLRARMAKLEARFGDGEKPKERRGAKRVEAPASKAKPNEKAKPKAKTVAKGKRR